MISLAIAIIIVAAGIYFYRKRPTTQNNITPATTAQLLQQNVAFYQNLSPADKKLFEVRVEDFLAHVSITGIGVIVEDLDKVLVAAGAIIPIFAFPDWRYNNIDEVLLYKGTFNKEYSVDANDRDILGMVGDGAMHRQMILSKPSLRSSFANETDGHNTVIHEFVHLLDKADGSTDGIPEYLLSRPYLIPWVKQMHETITEMRTKGGSDINMYGATNDAEFFAVVSEYFFERPHQLQEHHPELFSLLQQMFHPQPS